MAAELTFVLIARGHHVRIGEHANTLVLDVLRGEEVVALAPPLALDLAEDVIGVVLLHRLVGLRLALRRRFAERKILRVFRAQVLLVHLLLRIRREVARALEALVKAYDIGVRGL